MERVLGITLKKEDIIWWRKIEENDMQKGIQDMSCGLQAGWAV